MKNYIKTWKGFFSKSSLDLLFPMQLDLNDSCQMSKFILENWIRTQHLSSYCNTVCRKQMSSCLFYGTSALKCHAPEHDSLPIHVRGVLKQDTFSRGLTGIYQDQTWQCWCQTKVILLKSLTGICVHFITNEQQIITDCPIDVAMGSSGGGRVRKLSVVCLHNNAIVARGILATVLHCGTPEPAQRHLYC